jgi:hypothetical protein
MFINQIDQLELEEMYCMVVYMFVLFLEIKSYSFLLQNQSLMTITVVLTSK